VTRAQTAKMISLAQGWNLVSPSNATFSDMPSSNGMYAYVETASANGIISGYGCGGAGEPCDGQNRPYFRPGAVVTRAQLSKMLARSLNSGAAEKK
ncbi:MAG: S-layer homology domain-containing protein, partial [Chloroflexia bacterium]